MTTEVIFYFDVVCPYAYLASSQVHELYNIPGVRVLWQPVVLGLPQFYEHTQIDKTNN